ncbi:MAG: mitochondrial fission ELM1 family protein [Pseudomonadota bacterium]
MITRCLIVSSPGKKGHERQARGVAGRLGAQSTVCPANEVAADLRLAQDHDLVLCAGRQSIPVGRQLATARHGDRRPVVAVLQPVRWRPGAFDLMWAPAHDRARSKLIRPRAFVETLTAPCVVTRDEMAEAAKTLGETLDWGPPPHVGVLIGGKSRAHRFEKAEIEDLASRLAAFAKTHEARLLVTTSPRSPADAAKLIRARIGEDHLVFDPRNPGPLDPGLVYPAILGRAGTFIVTSDSFAMMSEAVFTQKPVYGWRVPGGKPKFERFFRGLEEKGALRWFDGGLATWSYEPLDAAQTIADALVPMLDLASASKERI